MPAAERNTLTGSTVFQEQQIDQPLQQAQSNDVVPTSFALKFIDTDINRAINVEPDQSTIILINLKKNIVTQIGN